MYFENVLTSPISIICYHIAILSTLPYFCVMRKISLLLLFMSVKALEVIEPFNLTLVHRVMEFGPYYGDQSILRNDYLIIDITAYLEVANPITVCNGIQEDYSNLIVLAMKH